MFKFEKLKQYLLKSNSQEIILSENDLNMLIDGGLNEGAFSSRSYFSNDKTHAIARAWFDCGYYCSRVDKYNKTITFKRIDAREKRMVSSDLLYRFYNQKQTPSFITIVSPFTFVEMCRIGVNQNNLKEYLLSINAVFVDFTCSEISFDSFYDIVNGKMDHIWLSTKMSHTYESFVNYVFATCFVNVGIDTDAIIRLLNYGKAPINYFSDYNNEYSLREVFKYMCDNIDSDKTIEEISNEIIGLDIKQLQRFMTEASPLEMLFYDFAVDNFIERWKKEQRFIISPKLVEEMLNVSLISIKKDLVYLTNQKDTQSLLISSVKNRVFIE